MIEDESPVEDADEPRLVLGDLELREEIARGVEQQKQQEQRS